MSTDGESILRAALQLSEADQIELATRLLAEVSPPGTLSLDDPALLDELDRRAHDGADTIPWRQLEAEG
ncbi:MAG: hypothetical protein K1X71_10415 [Pirellulales bacterium]|nr:hypothetical protein [Pirellulales bacterium]